NAANLMSEESVSEPVLVDLEDPRIISVSSPQYTDFNNWYNIRDLIVNVNCQDKSLKGVYYGLLSVSDQQPLYKLQFSSNLSLKIHLVYSQVHYLHLACVDEAGNYNYTIVTLKFDNVHPIAPAMLPVRILDNGTYLFEWYGARDNIGISHYELMILDSNNNVVKMVNVTDTKYYDSTLTYGTYVGKVRAYDYANNPSLWSDFAGFEYDDTPPQILAFGPQGKVPYDVVDLYVRTDDVSICSYVFEGEKKAFDYTDSTHHKSVVSLPYPGQYVVNVTCKNKVNLQSTFVYSFYYEINVLASSMNVYQTRTFYDDQNVEIFVDVKDSQNNPISNFRRSDFKISLERLNPYGVVSAQYSFTDFGNGTYSFTIPLPAGQYRFNVSLQGLKRSYTFEVMPLFANFSILEQNLNVSNYYVFGESNQVYYGVARKSENQVISNNAIVSPASTYFDMFFIPYELSLERGMEALKNEFINYGMPLDYKTVSIKIEYPDVIVELDPMFTYYSLVTGKRTIRVRNEGFDNETRKVKIKIELVS
ncbi:MAG: hypothetical protein QW524_04050, partial [Candidatus Woesearchaeota archaeon]